MKKALIIVIALWLYGFVQAQESTLSTGGEATGSGGSVSYSIGQIAIQYKANDTISFSEGVQQPYEISLNGVDDYPSIVLHAQLYPNPTQWNTTLSIGDIDLITKGIYAKLYDGNGKLLDEITVASENTLIEMSTYASGTYFLNIFDQKSSLKNFKIVKTR